MLILPRRKWLLYKMLLSFLYGLYFLCQISAAVHNSFFLPPVHPFIHLQYISFSFFQTATALIVVCSGAVC